MVVDLRHVPLLLSIAVHPDAVPVLPRMEFSKALEWVRSIQSASLQVCTLYGRGPAVKLKLCLQQAVGKVLLSSRSPQLPVVPTVRIHPLASKSLGLEVFN